LIYDLSAFLSKEGSRNDLNKLLAWN